MNTVIYNERKLRMHPWGIALHIIKILFQNMFLKNYFKIIMSFTNNMFMKDSIFKGIFYMSLKDYEFMLSSKTIFKIPSPYLPEELQNENIRYNCFFETIWRKKYENQKCLKKYGHLKKIVHFCFEQLLNFVGSLFCFQSIYPTTINERVWQCELIGYTPPTRTDEDVIESLKSVREWTNNELHAFGYNAKWLNTIVNELMCFNTN